MSPRHAAELRDKIQAEQRALMATKDMAVERETDKAVFSSVSCKHVYTTMTVFEFPPSESCSNLVSWLLRYGVCVLFLSTRADITIPRLDSERLMLAASSFLIPVAPVLDNLSEPLKQTMNTHKYYCQLVYRIIQ